MTLRPYDFRLSACAPCPRHDGSGLCREAGRDIREMAESAVCPLGRYAGLPVDGPEYQRSVMRGLIGIARAVTHVGRADAAVIARRRSICRACEHSVPGPLGLPPSCARCGCQLWAKATLATERCPAAKW